jgi:hypothetical protein
MISEHIVKERLYFWRWLPNVINGQAKETTRFDDITQTGSFLVSVYYAEALC